MFHVILTQGKYPKVNLVPEGKPTRLGMVNDPIHKYDAANKNYADQILKARNGANVFQGFVEQGGNLVRNTQINTGAHQYELVSGDYKFSNIPFVYGPLSIPQLGISADDVFHNAIFDRDAFSPGLGKQVMNGYFNFATGEFAGLETGLDPNTGLYITNLSARKVTQDGLQAGFSAKGASLTEATADHYLFDQDILSDIAGNFVGSLGIYSWWAFNIVDADNWDEHRVDLNDNGWEWKFGSKKVAGVTTPGAALKYNANGLVLPNLSVEPTGENGAMYYNTASNKFRVFENGAWRDMG